MDRIRMPELAREIAQLVIFVGLGCFVAKGVVQPSTAAQAIAAGMSWTGFFSAPR
ncbi:hypothetical protein [Umezakia ovalisporum]|uniref:hypothetical protein n=1 Tax=Umezakia ovalisporum TaxID=75695 RepID=UPI0039C6937F